MFKKNKLSQAILSVAVASTMGAGHALAQGPTNEVLEEVVVTGIRASLERSMDIKRQAAGVVDAISAEDIGKFPDTNLAESMQRIKGVSIARVNGEGSQVTVRGFGAQFNLVTLNGRQMPTSRVGTIGGDQNADFATGTSRSFEFGNIASEGVSGLSVYKTGQASVASGGIGATVNINTVRPLDNPDVSGSFGVKLLHDTSVEFSGKDVTPEVSGLLNWSNDQGNFGVSLFGSFQQRHSASRSATVNGWNILTTQAFLDPSSGMVRNDGSTVHNADNLSMGQFVSIPNDSRWHLAEAERERINGVLTVQFRPIEELTLTADAFYASNETIEMRTDQTNWFNRPFNQVIFDQDPIVASAIYLQENIAGVKDTGFEQQFRGVENTVQSFGFNADWQFSDGISLNLDLHTGKSESLPGTPATAGAPGPGRRRRRGRRARPRRGPPGSGRRARPARDGRGRPPHP
jgi:TonB-dependent receptor